MPSLVSTSSPKRGKYTYYSPKEKKDIMEEADLCGLRETALKWNLPPSTLSWVKVQNFQNPELSKIRILNLLYEAIISKIPSLMVYYTFR